MSATEGSAPSIEKEMLLMVDFVDSPDNFLDEIKGEIMKFANLDSTNPAVQVGHLLFKGNYVHSLDTNLIFEMPQQTPEASTSTSGEGIPKEYIGATTKVLEIRRAILEPEKTPDDSSKMTVDVNS